MNKSTAKSIADSFINLYFPECYGALLTGSAVDGHWTEESDIDIIIISQLDNEWFIECFEFQGLMLQTIVLPLNKVKQALMDDFHKREGIYIGMISKGIILKDNNSYLEKLIEDVEFLKKKGVPERPKEYIRYLHIKTSSLLSDLKGSKNFDECFFIMNDLTRFVADLNLSHVRMFDKGVGKMATRYLKEVDSQLFSNLVAGHQEFAKSKDTSLFQQVVEDNLKKFGGLLNYYSTAEIIKAVKKDRLILKFSNCSDLNASFIDIFIPINSFLKEVVRESGLIYWLRHRERGSLEESFYMVVVKNKDYINDYLVPRINQYYSNNGTILKKSGVQLQYPIDVPLEYGFGCGESVWIAEKLLNEVSETNFNILNQPDFYSKIICLLNHVGEVLFPKDQYNMFLTVLYDQWFTNYMNKDDIHTNEQYKQRKLEIENGFENKYQELLRNSGISDKNEPLVNHDGIRQELTNLKEQLIAIQSKNELYTFQFLAQQIKVDLEESDKQIWVYHLNLFERIADCLFIAGENRSLLIYILIRASSNKEIGVLADQVL